MTEKKKIYPNPRFETFEEEDKYWATHSPLAEGYAGEAQTERQKRSSFLSVRLTGEELTQLRDLAGRKGLGPSTFIRTLIKDALGSPLAAAAGSGKSGDFHVMERKQVHARKAGKVLAIREKAKGQYRVPRKRPVNSAAVKRRSLA